MKKVSIFLFIMLIITPPHIYAQLGKTVFPKIGFADPYTVSKVPFRYGGGDHPLTGNQLNNFTNSNKYYFPLLKSLGLTHLVTGVDQNVTLNENYNSNDDRLKIFDIGIEWRQPYSKSFIYSYAEGASHITYPYEVGGDTKAPLSPSAGNYGFGTADQTAQWFGDPVTPILRQLVIILPFPLVNM